jgi:hypothetical protein
MFPFSFISGGAAIDAQAQAHFDRVIADGGLIPSGLSGVNAFFTTVKTIYATSDITTAISVGLDAQVLGYKLGAGAGTTAGQAAQKLYSCSGASGDVVQTTAASQPLLLVHSGANYWYSGATNENYLSTNNSVPTTFSGDFDVKIRLQNLSTSGTSVFISKRGGGGGFVFYVNAITGILSVEPYAVDSTVGISNNFSGWLRIIKTSSYIQFLTGDNTENPTFTQLGAAIFGTFGNPSGNTDILGIGGIYNTSTPSYFPVLGKILRVTKANSIDGSPVFDCNPNSYNAATSQTQWTSSTGEVWTINTNAAATGYKGVLVDKSITMFDGIEDFLQNPTILRGDICSQYLVYKTENASASGISIIDSALSAYQNAFTPESSLMRLYMNGSAGNVSKSLDTLLTMYTTTNNQGVSNSIQKNNDTPTTNAYTPALSGTGLSIGKLANLAFYQKGNVQTYISAIGVNTTTIRTDMYNYIRSINNNAF